MSAKREWRLTSVQRTDHGPRQSAIEIRCGRCDAVDHVINRTSPLPPEVFEKKFAQAGWTVGAKPSADRCPDCAAKESARKPALKIVETPPMPDSNASETPRADQPRAMTRDERRVIFAKLEETYVDEATGYSAGWSDVRVAEDLGVPRAWIETIRDENFGPHGVAADMRELVEAQAALRAELERLGQAGNDLKDRIDALAGDLAEHLGRRSAAADRLADIDRRLKAAGAVR